MPQCSRLQLPVLQADSFCRQWYKERETTAHEAEIVLHGQSDGVQIIEEHQHGTPDQRLQPDDLNAWESIWPGGMVSDLSSASREA